MFVVGREAPGQCECVCRSVFDTFLGGKRAAGRGRAAGLR